MSELQHALDEAADWLDHLASNGPDLRINAHKKAAHEAEELAADPSLEEWADVLICLVGTRLAHHWTEAQVAEAVLAKVGVNRARTWRCEADGTWQHETPAES